MKAIIVTLVVLTTIEFSYSQPVFGVKGGINLNEIVIENAPFLPILTYENNVGFHIGIFSQFTLIEQLAIRPELQFIQKGANSDDSRINLNYLELPLLVSFAFIKMFRVEAGPSVSYLLSANALTDGTPDGSEVFDKPLDFGFTGGIRINFNNKISMVGRYYYGLSPNRSFPTTLPDFNPTSVNRNFQVGLSYLLTKVN